MSYFSIRKKILRIIIRLPLNVHGRNIILRKMGVIIGQNTGIGHNLFLCDRSSDKGLVIIGSNVDIAANVTITTTSGPKHSILKSIYPTVAEKVVIEDHVWIGNNVTILPGVTIGKCSIIGSGCILSKDIPPYSVVTCSTNVCKQMPRALLNRLEKEL